MGVFREFVCDKDLEPMSEDDWNAGVYIDSILRCLECVHINREVRNQRNLLPIDD
jgi:hypothetical protein